MDGGTSGTGCEISSGQRLKVLSFLRRHVRDEQLAEDLAQETLLRGFRHAGRLRDPRALEGWLLRIAYHVAMDWHRRGRRKLEGQGLPVADEELPPVLASEPWSPEATELETQRRAWSQELRRALCRLPPLDGVLLIAHYFVGRSCREIAQRSGLSLANVKVRLHRARRRLRRYLPPMDEFREFTARRQDAAVGSAWPREKAARLRYARRCRPSRQAR